MNHSTRSTLVRRTLRLLALVASAVAWSSPTQATETRAFVYTTDFSSGTIADIQFGPPRIVSSNLATVASDAVLRYFDGYLYVVNRFGFDNIQILDPANNFATVLQFSVGNGSNPHDMELVSPTKAYVARYDSPDLWIVNPQTGGHTGTISLAPFADADGIPEMDRLALRNGRLFVTIQRLDRNNFFTPTDSSQIIVINPVTDTIIDADAVSPGLQGILLPFQNPLTELLADPAGDLVVGCAGSFGVLDGGLVRIDPGTLTIAAVEISEATLAGDINDVAPLDGGRGFVVVSDASFNTLLRSYNRANGTVTGTPFATTGFSIADIEINDRGELWLCDRTPSDPGVRVFDGASGSQLTVAPLNTGLPPQDLTFDPASPVGVPWADNGIAPQPLALLQVYPNPSVDLSRIRFRISATFEGGVQPLDLAIYDLAGRSVFGTTLSGMVDGEHTVEWDGRNNHGSRVPRGVYLLELRFGTYRSSARVIRF